MIERSSPCASTARHRLAGLPAGRAVRRYSWKQLPLEAYPDIADVTSQIVTQVPAWPPRKSSSRSPFRWSARSGHARHARAALAQPVRPVADHRGVRGRRDGYWSRQRLQERMDGVTCPMARSRARPLTSPTVKSTAIRWNRRRASLRELSELQFWVVIRA
jgi:cobalt-zinc-cadmium resistance protein CzcA